MNNKNITLIVQTPNEKNYYKTISRKIRIEFVPYCSDFISPKSTSKQTESYIFTGGYTNRDYELIRKLANEFPKEKFVIIASKLNKDCDSMPSNILIEKEVPNNKFEEILSKATTVIVPLKEDVGSSGQMLCISAMRNRKPIIYTNVSSINYYFTSTSGYPYQIGDIDSLKLALSKCLNDKNKAKLFGENAYKESLKYTAKICFEKLDKILDIYTSN